MVIFDALVREQGISAAARRLGVSKSHISKQLALLETTLGAQLVQRTTRRFALTELGQEYARHCHALVAVAQEDHRQAVQVAAVDMRPRHYRSHQMKA
jgi:DNA-binding transcriptional LysR family regulator